MRLYEFLHAIVHKFSAMDDSEADKLKHEAQKDYEENVEAARNKKRDAIRIRQENADGLGDPSYKEKKVPELTQAERFLVGCENYKSRYGFALAFVVLVPVIRDYMNGGEGDQEGGGVPPEMMAQMFEIMSRSRDYSKNK